MKRDSFDELFDRSGLPPEDGAVSPDMFSGDVAAPDLVDDVLARVDTHRSFVKPEQGRRILAGRWIISGLFALGLLAGVVGYDRLLRSDDSAGSVQATAGLIPVSGEVSRVNREVKSQISSLMAQRSADAETDPEILRRLQEARREGVLVLRPESVLYIEVPGVDSQPSTTDLEPSRWDVRSSDGLPVSRQP